MATDGMELLWKYLPETAVSPPSRTSNCTQKFTLVGRELGDESKLDLPKWSEGSGFPGRPEEIAGLLQKVRGNSGVREEPGAKGGRHLSTTAAGTRNWPTDTAVLDS